MRWVMRLGAVLFGLLVLAGAALFLIPSEKVAQIATAEFSRATGRQLTLEGGVKPTVWPVLGIKTGAVTLANAAWSKEGPMLRAEGMTIGLDVVALIGGNIRITEVVATAPQIVLERNAKGVGNWEFQSLAANADSTIASTRSFVLDQAEISNGSLTFIDHSTGLRQSLSAMTLSTAIPDMNGPVTLNLQAVMNGQTLATTATVGDFARFVEGKLVALTLKSQVGKASVALEGRAGFAPMMAEGALTADLTDLAAVAALAGQSAPALPDGFGRRTLTLGGALTLTESGSLHLRGATLTADDLVVKGDADLTTAGARPKLTAKLSAGAIRLPQTAAGRGAKAAEASGWSKEPIDASGLAALDAEVALVAQGLDLGVAKLGSVRMLVTIDRGRAVFAVKEALAYEGKITGQFVVNARKGLSVGGDLIFAGLAMQPLLTDLAGYDRLIGKGDVVVKFLGAGNTLDAIMHSLSGDGRLSFGTGELRGLDLAGMLRTLDPGYVGAGAKTIFDKLDIGFAMQGGVAQSDDLALAAPLITATGAGKLNLGAQTIDYRVLPTALAGIAGKSGVTVPVTIKGPWDAPKIKLDLESLAQEKIDAERARLKARAEEERLRLEAEAKAKLAQKAQDALGITAQEGESLEAAAKRRAQEALEAEAARALGRLLGGN